MSKSSRLPTGQTIAGLVTVQQIDFYQVCTGFPCGFILRISQDHLQYLAFTELSAGLFGILFPIALGTEERFCGNYLQNH